MFSLSIPRPGSMHCCLIPANHPIPTNDGERFYSPLVPSWLQTGIYLTGPELLWRVSGGSRCAGSGGFFNRISPISPQISSRAPFPSQCPPRWDLWRSCSLDRGQKWGLFREGHVASRGNDKPGRGSSEAGIGWLRSQEHGRGQEVWQKGIWGLSCSWRHHVPGQELSLGA